jgi:hypothetical protein
MRRKLLTLVGFASGALAGTAVYRRRLGTSRLRLDVYFDDGSFITFGSDSSEGERLMPLAQQVLTAARRA